MSILALEELTHCYSPHGDPVLRGVSTVFDASGVYGIVGPSGSGKSTLLSLIGLLMRPTKGRVIVSGEDAWRSVRQAQEVRRNAFAWVLQNTACLEARTAVDNVLLSLLAQGRPRKPARSAALDALERVGLGGRVQARANELSGGELQRMTIARALLGERPIILADEPTGQLDAANSAAVADALQSCAALGCTVIVATHDPMVARRCDHVLTLDQGIVVSTEVSDPRPGARL